MTIEPVLLAARAASSKTLDETVVLDVAELISITGHFVITSGRNDRQVRAIVDETTKTLREQAGLIPIGTEGQTDGHWVLLDYGDFVVHVFDTEARAFYDLERLWSDAGKVRFDDIADDKVTVGSAAPLT